MRSSPWDAILNLAPELIKFARELATSSRTRAANIAGADDVRALRERLAELATDQQAHTMLLSQITEQINEIARASRWAAERGRQAFIIGGIGAALGLAALIVSLLR